MKITLLTFGSRGDVQPFVALAKGLQRAGHLVRLAAPHRFAGFIAQHGLSFSALPGDPEVISQRLHAAGRNPVKMISGMNSYVMEIAPQVLRASLEACQDADLVVHSFLFTTGGHSFARQRGIPDVSAQIFPMFAPTRAFPNPAAASLPPGLASYLSHTFSTFIFYRFGNLGYRSLLAADKSLPRLKLSWPFDHGTPLLMAFSPRVVPRPVEWDRPGIYMPGFFFLEEAAAYQPPAPLQRFLEAGDPPVCVTFGSMIHADAGRIQTVVRQVLAQSGLRAVVLSGWGGIQPESPGADLFYLDAAPHDWLLPRCKFVVHHGGSGTTAAGLRAGIPAVVLPHAADQPFWGRRVAAIGAGPAPLNLKRLTTQDLARAFEQAESQPIRARAAELGGLLRAEDGVGNAVRIIEAV